MSAPSGRECFEVSVEAKVAHIRFSRPERMNAMTLAFWREMPEIAKELDARGDVRAAVSSSTGKHSTDGMDLSVFQTSDALGTDSIAARAERLGFVNGMFDTHEALVEGALAVARKIASKAPVAVAATKQMISFTRDHGVAESFEYLNALQPGIFSIEDIQRAVAAAKSGKPAEFEDLSPRSASGS